MVAIVGKALGFSVERDGIELNATLGRGVGNEDGLPVGSSVEETVRLSVANDGVPVGWPVGDMVFAMGASVNSSKEDTDGSLVTELNPSVGRTIGPSIGLFTGGLVCLIVGTESEISPGATVGMTEGLSVMINSMS